MAINFNQNSVFNLKPINNESVRGEVNALLISGEEVLYAFKTVRDQLVFTNKRIIAIDVQELIGMHLNLLNQENFGISVWKQLRIQLL